MKNPQDRKTIFTNAVRPSAPATARRINWNPYLTGIGIGVLSWIVFVVVNNPIGITTALSHVSGGVASLFVGADVVAANKYWAKNAFSLDYGTLFLVGTLLGGLGSARSVYGYLNGRQAVYDHTFRELRYFKERLEAVASADVP